MREKKRRHRALARRRRDGNLTPRLAGVECGQPTRCRRLPVAPRLAPRSASVPRVATCLCDLVRRTRLAAWRRSLGRGVRERCRSRVQIEVWGQAFHMSLEFSLRKEAARIDAGSERRRPVKFQPRWAAMARHRGSRQLLDGCGSKAVGMRLVRPWDASIRPEIDRVGFLVPALSPPADGPSQQGFPRAIAREFSVSSPRYR